MRWYDKTALTLVIIGALNWLLVGVFSFNVVTFLFGNLPWISRTIYALIGICGLILLGLFSKFNKNVDAYTK